MKHKADLRNVELIDLLANIEHQRWAHWQNYLHSQCEAQDDGALLIPAHLAKRWKRQIKTPYSDLTLPEQKSDIEQVMKYIPTIEKYLNK